MPELKIEASASNLEDLNSFIDAIIDMPANVILTGNNATIFCQDIDFCVETPMIEEWKKQAVAHNITKFSASYICGWKNECLYDSEWPDARTP